MNSYVETMYTILQLIDTGFLVKRAKFFNVAYMLYHLKILESQRVILLKHFCLEKMLEIEIINQFINVSIEKEF